jgi:hypothetical protein
MQQQTEMNFGVPLCRGAEPLDEAKLREQVRRDVAGILAELRAAKTMPWDDRKLGMWRVVMPQTTKWLPDDERTRVCAEFDAEIARLLAATSAAG